MMTNFFMMRTLATIPPSAALRLPGNMTRLIAKCHFHGTLFLQHPHECTLNRLH